MLFIIRVAVELIFNMIICGGTRGIGYFVLSLERRKENGG